MRIPYGPGVYIWQVGMVYKGDPQRIADVCQQMGITWVTLKIADGVNPPKADAKWSNTLLRPVIAELRRRGIQVWGWHYVYGYSPVAEAKVGAQKCKDLGLDGYMIDAEGEYKLPGRASAAKLYMEELRRQLGSAFPIALASFRYISLHRELPWNVFKGVDIWMPQVYWCKAHNPGAQTKKSKAEYDALKPLPFVPSGAAYNEWGWEPTPAELVEFVRTCKQMGLPGFVWWELSDMIRHPMWLDTLALVHAECYPRSGSAPVVTPPVEKPATPAPTTFRVIVTSSIGVNARKTPAGTAYTGYSVNTVLEIDQTQVVSGNRTPAFNGTWGRVAGKGLWIHLGNTKRL